VAEEFLLALTGSRDSEVTFQTFTDAKKRKNRDLARVLHGTLSEHWLELVRLNKLGAGIFIMVNEGDLKGRSAENVRGLRSLFVDDDSGKLHPATLKIAPSIIVQSKNGPHAYWRLRPGESLERFEPAQAALAANLGTDPAVKDLPRVMRLPGFLHRKTRDPFLVEVIQINPVVYTIAEVLDRFGISAETKKPPPSNGSNGAAPPPLSSDTFERARRYLEKIPPAIEGQHGDDHTYRVAAVLVVDFNLSDDDAFTVLKEWNCICSPPWSDADLRRFIGNARKYGKHHPGAKASEQRGHHNSARNVDLAGDGLEPHLGQFELTESGTAERFVSEHGQNIRFCNEWKKWLTWDGKWWRVEGATGRVQRFLKRTLRKARTDAARVGDKEMVAWLFAAEKRSTRDNIVSLSRHEAEVQVESGDLDVKPMLLNCSNGTIDLTTAKLRAHQRSDLITQITRVEYIPHATCPRWEAFLDKILAGDRSLIAFVRRAVGYSLSGEIREHVLFILWGSGANGKSTLLEVLLSLFGRYGTSAARDLLIAKTHDRHPTELVDLFRARFVVCHETNEEQRFDESKLKTLTGGDRIKTRRMGEDFWEFSPTHKLWLGTNHRPAIRGTDLAIWRRIHLVPFEVTIPPAEQDAELPAKLKQELPGILKWTLEGCLAWQREGLNPPAKVQAAVQEYRHSEDRFGAFIADCCVVGPRYQATTAVLYNGFKTWAEANNEFPLNSIAFGKKLREHGLSPITIGHAKVRGWGGIGLRTDADSASGPSFSARAHSDGLEDVSASVRAATVSDPSTTTTDNGKATELEYAREAARLTARADRAEAVRLRGFGRVAEADALEESAAEAEKPYASVEAREPIQ